MTDLPSRIRTAAENAGGLKWLSEEIGVPRKTLGNWLTGTNPKPDALRRIAEATKVSLQWLVTGEGDPYAREIVEGRVDEVADQESPAQPLGERENVDSGISEPYSSGERTDPSIVEKLDLIVEQLAKLTSEKNEPKAATYVPPPRPPATVTFLPFRASAGGGSVVLDDSPGLELDIDALSQQILRMRRKNIRLIEIIGDSMLPTFMSGDMVVADTSFPRRDDLPDDGEMYVISKDGELLVKRALWVDAGVIEWKSDNPEFAAIRVAGDEINQVKIIGKVVWLWRRAH